MFEIRAFDVPEHLYATVATREEVDQAIEALADLTLAQLLANGEGASDFWIAAVTYDSHGTHLVTHAVLVDVPPAPPVV